MSNNENTRPRMLTMGRMKLGILLTPVLFLVLLSCLTEPGVSVGPITRSTTLLAGLRVGEMTTFIQTSGNVYHIEIDLLHPERLVFADTSTLKVTDGVTMITLAGSSSSSGYTEGVGADARFNYITGFNQINHTSVLVVDNNNHCLRFVDRDTLRTSPFVGQCRTYGFTDGLSAQFKYPLSVIRDPRSTNKMLVSDYNNQAIRQVDLITGFTITIITHSDWLNYPRGLAFDIIEENLLITDNDIIRQYNFMSESPSTLAGSGSDGFSDGGLSTAQFSDPRELVPLSSSITLVADTNNNRLRVVDSTAGVVESICTGSYTHADGSAQDCKLYYPYTLLVSNGLIYVGESQRIRVLPYELKCPENMTVTIDGESETEARVSWIPPGGFKVNTTLPVGEHRYHYMVEDGTECVFSVSVEAVVPVGPVGLICQENITTTADVNSQTADVAYLDSRGSTVNATLPTGNHDFSYTLTDGTTCQFSVTVLGLPSDDTCSEADILKSADFGRNTAFISCGSREEQGLRLGVGSYDYNYSDNCSTTLSVIDYRVRRRLEFQAEYNITCAELEDPISRMIFLSSAQHPSEIEELCARECRLDEHLDIQFSCQDDVTTVTWPTDPILPGDSNSIPHAVQEKMLDEMSEGRVIYLLQVVMYNRRPPTVYPSADENGDTVRALLTPICVEGFTYDPETTTCSQAD